MKLWDKGFSLDKIIEHFTVGKDKELDLLIARYDIIGSLAHITMLQKINILTQNEYNQLKNELITLYKFAAEDKFIIEQGVEDVHSQVELELTRKLGETGKKIHAGRSRNDQVLLDLKLLYRDQVNDITSLVQKVFDIFISKSEEYKNILLPGYTHLQVAMPSSFGLWFGAYAESLTDDMQQMVAAYKIINQNPLGSGAGYGTSFPLNRQLTTDLLGFDNMNYNAVYAQMGRGKVEKILSVALSSIAATVSKFSMDACLFLSQNFNFISLPDEFTTGSSIMPHKKNPDVFELLRAKCNKLQALPVEIITMTNNLPSGYFRDYQVLKESVLPAFDLLKECLTILIYVVKEMKVNKDILEKDIYKYIFSVEEVNKLVLTGESFRNAYKKIGNDIVKGKFTPEKKIKHTHEGSIGNLCTDKIVDKMNSVVSQFNFENYKKAIRLLIEK